MTLHTFNKTVLHRKQTDLAPFQTDSYMSERDLQSRSDLNTNIPTCSDKTKQHGDLTKATTKAE